ncbi:MAG: serine--tRNA ligase [Flavobacteriales bacterium]
MLEVNFLREKTADAIEGLAKRNIAAENVINQIIAVDDLRKRTQAELDSLRADLKKFSDQIGSLMKEGKKDLANDMRNQVSALKETIKTLEDKLEESEKQVKTYLYTLPNVPAKAIPAGKSAADNVEVDAHGEIPKLGQNALPHWELAKKYDIIDFELGVKVSGAGFPFYKGRGARLQRAMIAYFLDQANKAGYTEYQAPLLINEESGIGTGQLPDKEGQMYHVTIDNLFLIPTAEVPITNIFRDVILKADELPVKCCGYTPCFRREAGSYGKDVRGLNRLHQFDKVEIVQIEHPNKSYEALEEMRAHVTGLIRSLGLPYRVLKLCGGDMGFASAFTYDMEVYSAAQEKWLEVSSTSNFETFQSNRLKLRFKDETGKTVLAHTLNGSALALPRMVAAILENNQTDRGIRIPEVLVPYTGFEWID